MHFCPARPARPAAARPRVALLEDADDEAQALTGLLEGSGYSVMRRATGEALLSMLKSDSFDLFILNWGLTDMNGFEVLRKLRAGDGGGCPVMVLTARTAEFDLVQALEGGADNCVTKPWRPLEMLARLKVMLRPPEQDMCGGIEQRHGYGFDARRLSVHMEDRDVVLRVKEFELALLLFRHMGQAVSRQHILHAIWPGGGGALGRSLDTHISRVRSRLQLVEERGFSLRAVYGMGYRLDRLACARTEPPARADASQLAV